MLQCNSWMKGDIDHYGETNPAVSLCLVGEASDRLSASYVLSDKRKGRKGISPNVLQFEVKDVTDQVKSWLNIRFLIPDRENKTPFYYFEQAR